MKTQTHTKTLWMVQTAILAAILILMAFTPLGYLKIGTISITFLTVPVVIGAILLGPSCGAVLGGVFGITSFIQCFGMDVFGTTLMGINPLFTFLMCMVPRILMGLFVGLIFRALVKFNKTMTWSLALASLSGAVINTGLFIGALLLFFGNSDYLQGFGDNLLAILGVLITVNALVEAVGCMIVGTAVTKALSLIMLRKPQITPES
ncbi:MAG: ECF transporter S component [Clostridiaceae bacterium]|nr:ECF transporter S component [Clostridiaceae bacterium]